MKKKPKPTPKKKPAKSSKGSTFWKWVKRTVLILFLAQLFYIVILKWVNPPITLTQLGSVFSGDGLKRDYVAYDDMSYYMKLAVISSEDQIYPDHSGFDWKSIEAAMKAYTR